MILVRRFLSAAIQGCRQFTHSQDSTVDDLYYAELGLSCADACKALGRGMSERRPDESGRLVIGVIEQLTT